MYNNLEKVKVCVYNGIDEAKKSIQKKQGRNEKTYEYFRYYSKKKR